MVRDKVQPYIVPTTELVDVVGRNGIGANASGSVVRRGFEGGRKSPVRVEKFGSSPMI